MKAIGTLTAVVCLMWSAMLAQTFKGVIPSQGLIFPEIVVGGTSESEINLLAQEPMLRREMSGSTPRTANLYPYWSTARKPCQSSPTP